MLGNSLNSYVHLSLHLHHHFHDHPYHPMGCSNDHHASLCHLFLDSDDVSGLQILPFLNYRRRCPLQSLLLVVFRDQICPLLDCCIPFQFRQVPYQQVVAVLLHLLQNQSLVVRHKDRFGDPALSIDRLPSLEFLAVNPWQIHAVL